MINHKVTMTKWEPIPGLDNNYCIESVIDNEDGFKITLLSYPEKKHTVIVMFRYSVRSYRVINDPNLEPLKDTQFSDKSTTWCFFKLINSEYLQWAASRSDGLSDAFEVIHFAIYAKEKTIEVLEAAEPHVKIIENA